MTTVLAPATIGNVGPGFDVLGLAVDGLFDQITVELVDGPSPAATVTGEGAGRIPTDADHNGAVIAATALLRRIGDRRGVRVSIDRSLPLAGGLGGSAADCAGAALAAAHACGRDVALSLVMTAALDGEERLAGRHLDNIAPCLLGGLCLVRGVAPPDAVRLPIAADVLAAWHIALVMPDFELPTREARAVLPDTVPRGLFVEQMANTAALTAAFALGDADLAARALTDLYAEPRRAPLIPGFHRAKAAALAAGALGASISGAGPTVFALCTDLSRAHAAAIAMREAFLPMASRTHFGPIARRGAIVAGT